MTRIHTPIIRADVLRGPLSRGQNGSVRSQTTSSLSSPLPVFGDGATAGCCADPDPAAGPGRGVALLPLAHATTATLDTSTCDHISARLHLMRASSRIPRTISMWNPETAAPQVCL